MDSASHPGVLGPYAVVDVLGEGGMGVVYLAEQTEPVRRRVALKVLRAERPSEQVLSRFEVERQALAAMEHPSIAKVFDAGVTADGRPYFAMEWVDGLPVDAFCDERRMPIQDRVRLFAEICRAVQHAHQKGIIHRDLKPSNVLVSDVDGQPLPRVIDFGIAKAVEAEDFDGERLTRDDQIVGTPAYMSPEQIDGSTDVDTRSDVYALGILLYQILVGALPHGPAAYRGWMAVAAHVHRETPRPVERLARLADTQETLARLRSTTVQALRSELGGDLAWIVERAMAKDRSHRYATVDALVLDLERYLTHRPVHARGAGAVYIARKFARRHRVGVAFTGTVVTALAVLAASMTVQAGRIAEARDVADARRVQAEGLIDFMLSDLREKVEPLGRLDILDDVGQQALAYFAALPADEFSDDELLSRSQALHQIGQVRLNGGRFPEGQEAFEESLRLARALSDRAPEDNTRLFALGQSEFWVGELRRRQEDLEETAASWGRYRDISGELVRREPNNLDYRLEVGYSHTNLGGIERERGNAPGAVDEFREALGIKQSLSALQPDNESWREQVARGHYNLGIALSEIGALGPALDEFRRDIELRRELLTASPDNATYQSRLGASLQFAADVFAAMGLAESARARLQEQRTVGLALVARDPANALWRRNLAVGSVKLAGLLADEGDVDGARHLLSEAEQELIRLTGENPRELAWRADLASIGRSQATVALEEGARASANAYLRSAEEELDAVLDARPELLRAKRHLAWVHIVQGESAAAAGDSAGARERWTGAAAALVGEVEGSRNWRDLAPLVRALTLLGDSVRAAPFVEALQSAGYAEPWFVTHQRRRP